MTDQEQQIVLLEREYPGWKVRVTGGVWFASRRSALTDVQRSAGGLALVGGRTPVLLVMAIADQERRIRSMPP